MFAALKNATQRLEVSAQAKAESQAIRMIALAGGAYPALKSAEARGENARVISVLRAAAPAAGTASGADVTGGLIPAFLNENRRNLVVFGYLPPLTTYQLGPNLALSP